MGMLSTLVGPVAGLAENIVNRIAPEKMSEADRTGAALQVQQLIEARESEVLKVQRDIMVAELKQDDAYTKRARPSILYIGLAMLIWNYAVRPMFPSLAPIDLPAEFWMAWGGVAGIYAIGRSAEKRKAADESLSPVLRAITGKS